MTTGQLIKAARKQAGFTQKELGEKLGITYQTIAQWENDLRNPKAETIMRIAGALEVAWTELVPEEDMHKYRVKTLSFDIPPSMTTGHVMDDFSIRLLEATANLSDADRRLVLDMARRLSEAGGGSAAVQTAKGPYYLYGYPDSEEATPPPPEDRDTAPEKKPPEGH